MAALVQLRKSHAGENGTGLPEPSGPEPDHRAGQVILNGQPLEELFQGTVLLVQVSLAVPAQKPLHPLPDICRVNLLPPGPIRLLKQVPGGEPARSAGVNPDGSLSLVLCRQVQPERGDVRRERPATS